MVISQWECFEGQSNGLVRFDDPLFTKETLADIASYFDPTQMVFLF